MNNKVYFFPLADLHLLSILNSKVGWYLIKNTCTQLRGGFNISWSLFGTIPIPKTKISELEPLVDKMLQLNEELRALKDKLTDERGRIEEKISRTNMKIDNLVYGLYGITDEKDKRIIEESVQ